MDIINIFYYFNIQHFYKCSRVRAEEEEREANSRRTTHTANSFWVKHATRKQNSTPRSLDILPQKHSNLIILRKCWRVTCLQYQVGPCASLSDKHFCKCLARKHLCKCYLTNICRSVGEWHASNRPMRVSGWPTFLQVFGREIFVQVVMNLFILKNYGLYKQWNKKNRMICGIKWCMIFSDIYV